LSGYIHLQKMELSSNKINDLSCISHMPYLVELNASKNKLTTYFSFKAPKNLKEADFSHNQIPKMQDLSAYHSLTKLLLDFNEIEEIRGLEKCHSLSQLGLSHNRLTTIQGLENLPIRILNLSFNQIEKVNGLKTLKALQRLDLSKNKINSLQGLEEHNLLEVINLEDNQVAELSELKWIEDLPLLRVLNLLKNPLQEEEGYWLSAIFMLLQVTELDLKEVSVEEKVAAVNKEDPPPEVVAAEDHRTHLSYNFQRPQRVLDSTLLNADEPYPMLVLLGPLACGKRQLCLKICKKLKNFFRFGPCHTTRTAYFGEENRLDYYFISQEEFDKMVKAGEFLATYEYSGHRYGLARETLESIAREGLGACVHLEIEGVRSLKNTHFKPRYVLLVPRDKEKYKEHLRRTGLFSRLEIEEALSRVDVYLQINHGFPGYFHVLINTGELICLLSFLLFFVSWNGSMQNFMEFLSEKGPTRIIQAQTPQQSHPGHLWERCPNAPGEVLGMCPFPGEPGQCPAASEGKTFPKIQPKAGTAPVVSCPCHREQRLERPRGVSPQLLLSRLNKPRALGPSSCKFLN
uniref:Leucine rich repeats and guanylate kinase domain containing n=1 Tax=Cyanistes caeruleus TaxID=156563 RepID=A0A8C0U567_CYACU